MNAIKTGAIAVLLLAAHSAASETGKPVITGDTIEGTRDARYCELILLAGGSHAAYAQIVDKTVNYDSLQNSATD